MPRRRRPDLPSWPLVNGVFAFPFYRETRVPWIAFSIGNLVMWGVLVFTWQVLVVVSAIMLLIGLMYFVWASRYCLTILTETANGVERIEDWSSSDVVERAFQALYLLNSLILSFLVGWGLEYLAGSLPQGIAPAATMFVLFPIVLLSMLERGTVLNPVSPAVWWSVLANGWAWLGFYVLAGLLVSAVVALDFGLRRLLGIWGSGLTAVLMATALMIYFRLLGRLGWYCSERSRDRSRSSDK